MCLCGTSKVLAVCTAIRHLYRACACATWRVNSPCKVNTLHNLSYYRPYTPHTVTNNATTSFCKLRCYSPCIQTTVAIATASKRAFSVTSLTINNTGNTNKAATTQPSVAKYKPQYSPFFVALWSCSISFPGLPC